MSSDLNVDGVCSLELDAGEVWSGDTLLSDAFQVDLAATLFPLALCAAVALLALHLGRAQRLAEAVSAAWGLFGGARPSDVEGASAEVPPDNVITLVFPKTIDDREAGPRRRVRRPR